MEPALYPALVGWRGQMISRLQSECGATVLTFQHSARREAKNEAKARDTAAMMQRWAERRRRKRQQLAQMDADPLSTRGMWTKWRPKGEDKDKDKQAVVERASVEAQLERLTHTRKWIAPKVAFEDAWRYKLMVVGDAEAKEAVRRYVADMAAKTHAVPLNRPQFRALFRSANFDKQRREHEVRVEERLRRKQPRQALRHKDADKVQIRVADLDVDESTDAPAPPTTPFVYRYEKLDHDALLRKLEREWRCILTLDADKLYISNAEDADAVKAELDAMCAAHVWRGFDAVDEVAGERGDANLEALNGALMRNKQVRWFLLDPAHAHNRRVWTETALRGQPVHWDRRRCELTLFGAAPMVRTALEAMQRHVSSFALLQLSASPRWRALAVAHPTVKGNVGAILAETAVRLFDLKRGAPLLIATKAKAKAGALEVARALLERLCAHTAQVHIAREQLQVARMVIPELERRFECDVLVEPEPEPDAEGQHTAHVLYHCEELKAQLVAELTRYVNDYLRGCSKGISPWIESSSYYYLRNVCCAVREFGGKRVCADCARS